MANPKAVKKIFLSLLREDADPKKLDAGFSYLFADDWQGLAELAQKNGLSPLLYRRLSGQNFQNIPADFQHSLKLQYLCGLKENTFLYKETLEIIRHLQGEHIPAVPLKGAFLARFFFEDLALRKVSGDIDLLVREEQFAPAISALEKIGYIDSGLELDRPGRQFKLKYSRQVTLSKKALGRNLFLDLHFDLRGLSSRAPLEDFWGRLRTMDVEGTQIFFPHPEELLIYLSLLAMRVYKYTGARYLYDIYAFIAKFRDQLDWQGLSERLKNSRHKASVFFALKLSAELFHYPLPRGLLKKISPGIAKRILLRAWINKKHNLLSVDPPAGFSWYWFSTTWVYFGIHYLYAQNIFEAFKEGFREFFLPLEDLAGYYRLPVSKVTNFLYLKRLLAPLAYFFKKKTARRGLKSFCHN